MSTENGKTCECTVTHFFATTSGKYEIAYCPLHDGSMAEKLAEALREITNSYHPEHIDATCMDGTLGTRIQQLLAAYDELQGRKG